jgi:A/G-specific adenine glycosylase
MTKTSNLISPKKLPLLQKKLLDWYKVNKRDFPWRNTRDPYFIWVSEVMLQQTQTATVIPFFQQFCVAFPNIKTLAQANLSEILKVWEGMGYYTRARNLHKTAKLIEQNYHGLIPCDSKSLVELPGIGKYTAAAIASITSGEPVPVLDGNVKRVLARWFAMEEVISGSETLGYLTGFAWQVLYKKDPATWNQAMMELGATICAPKTASCTTCPVSPFCLAFKLNLTNQIPRSKPRKVIPHHEVTAGIIHRGDQILIAKRKDEGLLGGLWEFPGGKQEAGETLQECLQRELREELAIEVSVGDLYCAIKHAYTHFRITLNVFECNYLSGVPQAIGCTEWRWIEPKDLTDFPFPKADRTIISKLLGED